MFTKTGVPLVLLVTVLSIGGCGDDDSPSPTTNAASPGLFDNLLSRMGGTVIPTSDEELFVEVIPHVDGKVTAIVMDADGELLEGDGTVQVQVAGDDGAPRPVTLRWDAVAQAYVGRAEEGVELDAGPMAISVSRSGQPPAVGQVDVVATAPAPAHGGRVVVAGEYAAELVPRTDGTIHAYVDGPNVGPGSPTAVQVEVQGTDGAPHPVLLSYDPSERHYVGRLSADVELAPGPMGFTVMADGGPRRTRVRRVVALGPAHGGDVVVAGDYAVEVVPHEDGTIDAWVVGEEPVEEGAEVVVTVGRERRPVTLVWSAEVGHFVGAVPEPVRIARAPIGVTVVHRGHRHVGAVLPRYTVAVHDTWGARIRPSAEVRLHGHPHGGPPGLRNHPLGGPPGLRGKGPGRIDVRGPDVRIQGPSGMVRVRGPGARVRVRGPSGMVRVRGPMGSVRVRGPMGSVRVRGPMGSVRVRGPMGSVRVRGPMGGARVRGPMGMRGMR